MTATYIALAYHMHEQSALTSDHADFALLCQVCGSYSLEFLRILNSY